MEGFSPAVTVEGVCNIPSNFQLPLLSDITRLHGPDIVYIYTDMFANCSGCVTGLSVCYTAFSEPNPMTVVIVNDVNIIVHVHDFTGPNSTDQTTNCIDYGSFSACCTQQEFSPSEQFVVESSHHYGIWSAEQLAVHPTLLVPGHYVTYELTPLEVGVNISTEIHSVERTLCHFTR